MRVIYIVLVSIVFLSSCKEEVFTSINVTTKEAYFDLKNQLEETQEAYKNNTIDKKTYARKMEVYGDSYTKSKKLIPPERRYTVSIMCYSEAMKYNKTPELKEKLQRQKEKYQVVNH
jgi:hypothetical protein